MRAGLIALVWSLGSCVEGPSPPKVAQDDVPPPPTVIVIGEPELDQYERGLRAELARLRVVGRPLASAESAGARAAGLGLETYDSMTRVVERYLRTHAGARSGWIPLLDSLRVERLVLRLRRQEDVCGDSGGGQPGC
ncbi:MAG TPA: hypothetical protein PKA50_01770 [Gemmatimonadales bacterium]|nr:hypothetical protein [Gemmatimonadales bacterium]